jgi:hypothetical protein
MGRPKGFVPSPETREKLRQAILTKLAGPESEAMRARFKAMAARANAPRTIAPPRGTKARSQFNKIRVVLGSAAAHAELRRSLTP